MTVIDLTPEDGSDVPPEVLDRLRAVPDPDGGEVPAEPEVLPTFEFYGQRFAVRERSSLLPMMKFAHVAKQIKQAAAQGTAVSGEQEMAAFAALFELLSQCIAPTDFDAFYEHALSVGASQEDLMHAVRDTQQARSGGRPTQPSSGSPGGRSTTATSSAAGSSSRAASVPQGSLAVQRRLEEQGRPDVALVVKRARQAASTSTSTG